MDSKETCIVVDGGRELHPPEIKNSKQRKESWKRKLKGLKEGQTFEWSLPGWQSVDQKYVTDEVKISLVIGENGALGCASGNCIHKNNRWFGKAMNTRGEINVQKHLIAYHTPHKYGKRIEGVSLQGSGKAASGKKRKLNNSIITSFFPVQSTKSNANKATDERSPKMAATSVFKEGIEKDLSTPVHNNGQMGQISPESIHASAVTKSMFSRQCPIIDTPMCRKEVESSSTFDLDNQGMNIATEFNYKPDLLPTKSNEYNVTVTDEKPSRKSSTAVTLFNESVENDFQSESSAGRTGLMLCQEYTPIDASQCRKEGVESSNVFDFDNRQMNIATRSSHKPHYILEIEMRNKKEAFRCKGIEVDLPEPREEHYPLLIHRKLNNPAFIFDFEIGNVRSSKCSHWVFQKQSASFLYQGDDIRCASCDSMNNNDQLNDIVERSKDVSFFKSKANAVYLTTTQMRQKINQTRKSRGSMRLAALSSDRNMEVVCKRLDSMKQLQTCLATDRIPRVQQILKRILKENRSSKVAIEFLSKAASGEYRPKGFDNRDLDMGILDNHIGGRRLIYAHNHSVTHLGPSARTVRRKAYMPQLLPLSSTIEDSIIKSNLERFIFNESATSKLDQEEKCLHTIMMDDVKVEKRVRVHEASQEVIGLCFHAHKNSIPLKICSYEDCKSIKDAFDNEEVHYATEMTTVAIGPNREKQHQIVIVGCSGGCLDDDPLERSADLLKCTMREYINNPKGQQLRGHLGTFQPDGAGTFSKIGQEIFFQEKMDKSHPLYETLSKLPLFNLHTNSNEFKLVTIGCELKHTFKRLRERMKNDMGIKFLNTSFNRDLITKLLEASGVSKNERKRMLAQGYADAMNVPAMVDLFKAIADMESMQPEDFGKLYSSVRNIYGELQLFIKYCKMIHTVLVGKVCLSEYMEILSTLMHINLVCYRLNGTAFIPAQNYQNQMRLYRSQYWSMAIAKKFGYKYYFPFLDSGDRLEEGFGLVRTLSGGASGTGDGMDALQCVERMAGVNQCNAVYAREPNLRKPSRHLTASRDHMNPSSYLLMAGGEKDYKRVSVKDVSLQHTYIDGRRVAAKMLKDLGFTKEELNWNKMSIDDIDMLRPQGQFVGVRIHDDACDEEDKTEVNEKDVVNELQSKYFERTSICHKYCRNQ